MSICFYVNLHALELSKFKISFLISDFKKDCNESCYGNLFRLKSETQIHIQIHIRQPAIKQRFIQKMSICTLNSII